MDKLDLYLLFIIQTFKRPRKKNFLFAILTGKRTGQAVTDSHLYQVENQFGLVPFLKEAIFEKRLLDLEKKGYVRIDESGVFLLKEQSETSYFKSPDWKGFSMQDLPHHFFNHLLLAVQVVSNKHHKKSQYLPIVRNKEAQIWVKRWFSKWQNDAHLAEKLFLELNQWLESPSILYQDVYVGRFSGGDRVGETALQICERLQISIWDGYFEWLRGLHVLHLRSNEFPLLQELMISKVALLTKSGFATYDLFQKGHSLEQIVNIRQLKKSTIEDHFVEIQATFQELAVPFRPNEEVLLKLKEKSFLSLKEMKEFMPDLSYFELRLAAVSGVEI
ncbi:helix-turn-helix domain-containing protein [Listeria fleischmannii]|uniref:helix-turn-helix domain-containing protein n=1 Tax=Listeria fleischmannii TaxID=1069827 RepID=UPI001623AA2F|nr:helix-turn-helix domain-containing protein [Listeria fleischmannii]MBC1418555.1 hypothetical protein [Listeria fleischmannii]